MKWLAIAKGIQLLMLQVTRTSVLLEGDNMLTGRSNSHSQFGSLASHDHLEQVDNEIGAIRPMISAIKQT